MFSFHHLPVPEPHQPHCINFLLYTHLNLPSFSLKPFPLNLSFLDALPLQSLLHAPAGSWHGMENPAGS